MEKHKGVARALRDQKARARREGKAPDPSKWKALATAGGYRSEAYHKASPEIKKLVDEFEGVNARNVVQGTLVGLSGGNPWARVNIEITRSDEFARILGAHIKELEEERTTLKGELDDLNRRIQKRIESRGAREQMDASAGGECFTADTWVWMANNTFKRIIDLEIGDRVQTFDVGIGKMIPKPVTNLYYAHQNHYYLINDVLKTTAQHPFFTAEGTWKVAGKLNVGDHIRSDAKSIVIRSIERIASKHTVYNFRVADSHNYFVSPDREELYLVHNCK
jgi:hypothetical protein